MKSNVSPVMFAVIIVLAIAALGVMGWKFLGPSSGSGASEDLRLTKPDPSALNPAAIDQLKKDLDAARSSRSGTAGAGPNAAKPTQGGGASN